MSETNPEAGFSLAELAVGIALLGIVAVATLNAFTNSSKSLALLQEQLHKNIVYDKLQYFAANLDAVKAAQAFNPLLRACFEQLTSTAVLVGGQRLCDGAMRLPAGVGLDFRNAAGGRLAGVSKANALRFTPQGELCVSANPKCTVLSYSSFRLLCEGNNQNCARPTTLRVSYTVEDRPVGKNSKKSGAVKEMKGYADHRLRDLVTLADYGCEKREGFSEISTGDAFKCNASLNTAGRLKGSKDPSSVTGVTQAWSDVDSFEIEVDAKQSLVLMLTVTAHCPATGGLNNNFTPPAGLTHVVELNPVFCGFRKEIKKQVAVGTRDRRCGYDKYSETDVYCAEPIMDEVTEIYKQSTCELSGDYRILRGNVPLRTGTYQTCDSVALNIKDNPGQGRHFYKLQAKAHAVPLKSKSVLSLPLLLPGIPFVTNLIHPLSPMNASIIKIPEP